MPHNIQSPQQAPSVSQQMLSRVDEAFRSSQLRDVPPPTRFYLNLTERCPLRCKHCITDAPVLTQSKQARVMTAEVLEALRPHLRHAVYVGLTHAGEPMTSPAFQPLLQLLEEERGAEPTVVHLLTNGLHVTVERFARLVRQGVVSWSFSIDGMSPATHDTLRLGSRIDRLLDTIGACAAHRQEHHPQVRLGISWTVTRHNVTELPALVAFAAKHHLDWVKVEEIYPVNHAAAQETVEDPEVLRTALEQATEMAQQQRLALLNHTHSLPVYKCLLEQEPLMRRYSILDDWANRMEINPCRLPWELVCVEPNGDIKPLNFHYPAAGNVLQQDLRSLWDTGPFVEARQNAIRQRVCPHGHPTCQPDPGPMGW